MTIDLFDGLGERLDAIAGDHTDHIELRHPAELPIGDDRVAGSSRVLWLGAAGILIAVAAAWIGLRAGADLKTEEPAADPDAAMTTRLAYGDLQPVFALEPLPDDDPAVIAKAEWWDPTTVRRVSFEGADVYLGIPGDDSGRICLDIRVEGSTEFTSGAEGSCNSLVTYLAGNPFLQPPSSSDSVIAGLLPTGANAVSADSVSAMMQLIDGVYFVPVRSGFQVETSGGEEPLTERGTVAGLLNGLEFEGELDTAACVSDRDTWWVTASGPDFAMRFGPGDGIVGEAFDSSTYGAALLNDYTVRSDESADRVRLTVGFEQGDTIGQAVIDCRYALDWADFTAGWFGS